MNVTQSIDDKIHGIKPRDFEPVEIKKESEQEKEADASEENRESEQAPEERETKPEKETQAKEIDDKSADLKAEKKEESTEDDSDEDEYGNKVEKSRMYSEEEVQRMIRDRLSRGNHQPTQQQVQQVQQQTQNSAADPNASEDWEAQLDSFIENKLQRRETAQQQREIEAQHQARQAEFESKFTTGMGKYKDFKEVVGKMPITDAMMMASRPMKDPAAFLYAASKMHPQDIERISKIDDPFAQATEVGKLEERMRKTAKLSKASAPLSQTKGDMSPSYVSKQSLEDKIAKHAKSKRR